MGIKHFFYWLNETHSNCMFKVSSNQQLQDYDIFIDTLAIDLNGLFHGAAQKIFGYGNYVSQPNSNQSFPELCRETYNLVLFMIEELVDKVKPRKRILLCVDGVAGMAKMIQQRQRRFKSVMDSRHNNRNKTKVTFDSNSITPGTTFMHFLTKYLHGWLMDSISQGKFKQQVIFSNEKVPGEGEHKIKSILRNRPLENETICIYGMDADLIMLAMAIGRPNIYIYRDSSKVENERYVINIDSFKQSLMNDMKTDSAVEDFVFICFLLGNDFLPPIPGIEIMNQGIYLLMDVYKKKCHEYGLVSKDYKIKLNMLFEYFEALSEYELEALKEKYHNRYRYMEDRLMEKHFYYIKGSETEIGCDFDALKSDYYKFKAEIESKRDMDHMCSEYIRGLQWVLDYYFKEIPSWEWYYEYNYAPFMADLAFTLKKVNYIKPFYKTIPFDSYLQLMIVLPKQSKRLLPDNIKDIHNDDELKSYYPYNPRLDYGWVKQEWEARVILPKIDLKLFQNKYRMLKKNISDKDKVRNHHQYTIVYRGLKDDEMPYNYKSSYSEIQDCTTRFDRYM